MQLMCDAVSVLGSRHGLLWDPLRKHCGIIRFMPFHERPNVQIRAGVIVDGKEIVFPLCREGETFGFLDQRISPCSMSLIGIDHASIVKAKLSVVTPFRPRDAAFSTTPILALRLSASKLAGGFRWHGKSIDVSEAEIFIEIISDDVQISKSGTDSLDLTFTQVCEAVGADGNPTGEKESIPQRDRLVVVDGERKGLRFTKRVSLPTGDAQEHLDILWCTHSQPVLQVQGMRFPFKYADRFADLDAVADWARENPTALFENAAKVDGIVAQNNCTPSVNHLLAQTLHSWLNDTWWVNRDGSDWFSVWEGSCYFHSTVDVEYTQTPFYLAVWPELLRAELDFWPEYSKDGASAIGERGAGTLFLSHDTGAHIAANGQRYPHEMEVEETTNYLILSYAYYKRTGDDTMINKHAEILERYLAFVAACDSTGNGVPDLGVANTIDDASPAIQFGREQVYLSVKALAAYVVGAELMQKLGKAELAATYRVLADKLRAVIDEKGWLGDHFATLLDKTGELIDPWTGVKSDCQEVPGWDAPHIYTVNGMALLDMVGVDLGIDREKITRDLEVATQRCLREYGCVHSDFTNMQASAEHTREGLAGAAWCPGWISMNMLRDIAAFYRGVDLRALAERYWEWQVVTNTQEPKIFFETFNGNDLCFYPRGIAIWGYFDALAGLVIDQTTGQMTANPSLQQIRVPRLYDADWQRGTATVITSDFSLTVR